MSIFFCRGILRMIRAVLIEKEIKEILLDINKIHIIIRGRPTFIGQWPEIDVVIIKAEEGGDYVNPNKLLPPFENEVVRGPILLVRMDENSEPQDFTVNEYESLLRRNERLAA
jgi:hypothetical protein